MEFLELVESNDTDLYDFEEKEALLWKQPTQENQREEVKTTVSPPGDVWIVPPRFKDVESHIERIEVATNTFMDFNKNENQIEIWGAAEDIEEAIMQWNNLSSNKLTFANERRKNEKNERIAAKKQEPGWAKPDKAPVNKKQEAKFKRREERKRKENMYKKKPEGSKQFPFNAFIVFPFTDVSKELLFGEKDEVLNPVRIETECHIWYDEPPGTRGIINIVGETKESVDQATIRVGHLFVKVFKARSLEKGWILHALEPPSKKCQIRITDPPSGFYLPYETPPKGLKYKFIEPVYEGDRISVVGGTNKELNQNFDNEKLERYHESNILKLKKYFLEVLEAIHLCDEEIKMRIRFGRVYLMNDKDIGKKLIPITDLNDRILKSSKFVTCLATERDQLNRLFEVLSEDNHKWGSSPSREFKIRAVRRDSDDKGQSLPQCVFEVQFEKDLIKNNYGKNDEKYEGRIGLWNAIIRQRDVFDINMMNMDNYSWKLNIKTAKRLPTDEKCPQGKFVNGLRICQQGRLVYLNTQEIRVISVCEKTKWKFWWNEDYIVEVTKYEFWEVLSHMKKTGIEIPLSREGRPKVSYGVTLYKRSWDERFAFNSNLRVGEAPDWYPHDMMEEEKNLLNDIRNFSKLLQKYHPMQEI